MIYDRLRAGLPTPTGRQLADALIVTIFATLFVLTYLVAWYVAGALGAVGFVRVLVAFVVALWMVLSA